MDKTAVFVDGGYIAMLTKFAFPSHEGIPRRLNFELLCKNICDERTVELLRGYYYHCPPFQSQYPTEEEKRRKQNYDKFIHGLKQLKRFQVREGRLSKVYDETKKPIYIQKGVDVLLAIDMIKLILKGAIQRIIIIACDSDFVPVVRAIREEGTIVELYHFTEGTENFLSSRYLLDEVDESFTLSKQLLEKSTIT